MIKTRQAYNGGVVAPHHLASQAGKRVLQEGGNAIEAMLAAASTIAVVYPHMNGLGGDNFWLISDGERSVHAIDSCGAAASLATVDWYKEQGHQNIPSRGPLAALTMAGAVGGWAAAHKYSQERLGGRLPLSRLFEEAIFYARNGVAVAETLATNAEAKQEELAGQSGFADLYLPGGRAVRTGDLLRQPAIADTLGQLARCGTEDFYQGELSQAMADDLERCGSPVRHADFASHETRFVDPLKTQLQSQPGSATGHHQVFNMPPPTQGLASLMILEIYQRVVERFNITTVDSFEYIHGLVEATKRAFRIRDRYVTDPTYMTQPAQSWLAPVVLDELASDITLDYASPWPELAEPGDTVWLGAIDSNGIGVSFIQSVYWEFGSGVILPSTGVTWQNRGTSFSLDPSHHNLLKPGRKPFHTIQPALAHLQGDRLMCYGTMGGEGQPQTQAMIFTRHVLYGMPLQQAITSPRWLLGRTWGSEATNLRIENRFDPQVLQQLAAVGHDIEIIGSMDEVMGHAGALVRDPGGLIQAGADPRSDGEAAVC